ncbi:MAG: hypothetical protein KF779_10250 [Hyphomonadaceae bacterium]|nr:hypothetical protein [Hyphomonadaceae bacterium]MCA8886987.1 hypothetical protein [Hyphomonadaceae bacterium]
MRFALIATTAAAVVAVPFAVAAAGPQMSSNEFLAAVRCAAYEDASGVQITEAKYELNAESRRQTAETVATAEAEIGAIALQAVNSQTPEDRAMLRAQRAAACAGADFAAGGQEANAV